MIAIKEGFAKYMFLGLVLALIYLSFIIVRPFLIAILSSFVIAFVFYPLYNRIYKKTKKENLSAFIVSVIILLIIIVPIFLIIDSTSKELLGLYNKVNTKLIEDKDLISVACSKNTTLCGFVNNINNDPKIRFYVSGAVTNLVSGFTKSTTNFLFSIPKKVVDVFLIFLLVFFLLQNGKKFWHTIKDILPLKSSHKEKFMDKIASTIRGVVYGYMITAVIEGIIGWLAFMLVGSKMAIVLGIIILITALLPVIGASIIWVPGAILYFLAGSPIKSIILIFAGTIIAWVDSWLRAKIIGDNIDIHPAIVVIGAFGGIMLMGLVGIIIGPLVLALFIKAIEIYRSEKLHLEL